MKALIISFVTHLAVIGAVLIASVLAPEAMPKLLKKINAPTFAAVVVPRDFPLTPSRQSNRASNTVTAAAPRVDEVNLPPLVAPAGVALESGNERSGSPGLA